MTDSIVMPRTEDSVGTRISWGAILGGGLVASAIYFVLTLLGAAVGLSVSESVKPTSLTTAAIIWEIVTLSSALFVGGLMASLFTVGENKVEAIFYGVIMWAFLLGLILVFGAAGVRNGFHGMVRLTNVDSSASAVGWEASAKEAGVSPEMIADWRKTAAMGKTTAKADDPQKQKEIIDAATRVAWFAFGGAWISMLAAAAGAWLGAGPTFRIVSVKSHTRIVSPT